MQKLRELNSLQDLERLPNGATVILETFDSSHLGRNLHKADYESGYFFIRGGDLEQGPDFAFNDIFQNSKVYIEVGHETPNA